MNICKQKNIQKFLAIMNFHLEENSIYIRFPINFKITLVYNSKSYLYNSAAMSYLIRSYTNVYRCFYRFNILYSWYSQMSNMYF